MPYVERLVSGETGYWYNGNRKNSSRNNDWDDGDSDTYDGADSETEEDSEGSLKDFIDDEVVSGTDDEERGSTSGDDGDHLDSPPPDCFYCTDSDFMSTDDDTTSGEDSMDTAPDTPPPDNPADKKTPKMKIDDGRPRKPRTSYMLYFQANRELIAKHNPELESVNALSKKCGEMWREMSSEDKEEWVEKAANLRDDYTEELARWKEQNGEDDKRKRLNSETEETDEGRAKNKITALKSDYAVRATGRHWKVVNFSELTTKCDKEKGSLKKQYRKDRHWMVVNFSELTTKENRNLTKDVAALTKTTCSRPFPTWWIDRTPFMRPKGSILRQANSKHKKKMLKMMLKAEDVSCSCCDELVDPLDCVCKSCGGPTCDDHTNSCERCDASYCDTCRPQNERCTECKGVGLLTCCEASECSCGDIVCKECIREYHYDCHLYS